LFEKQLGLLEDTIDEFELIDDELFAEIKI